MRPLPASPARPPRPLLRLLAVGLTVLVACNTPPSARPTPPSSLSVDNLDGFPLSGNGVTRLVFSRIHDNSASQCVVDGRQTAAPCVVHDRVTQRIRNSGSRAVLLSSPRLDANWQLDPAVSFPQSVAAGGSLELTLRFVGDQAPTLPPRLYTGTFALTTDDPATPTLSVQLAGVWQATGERFSGNNRYDEPSLELIRQALGQNIALSDPGEPPPSNDQDPTDGSQVPYNRWGAVVAQGDEVLSAYWLAATPGQAVTVRQIGSWSGQTGTATLNTYPKGSPGSLSPLFQRSNANSAQTLFPFAQGARVPGPSASFTPAAPFGFNVTGEAGSGNNEFSDSTLNRQRGQTYGDNNHGCTAYTQYANAPDNTNLCGHHLRFWPITDASGARVPNAYLLVLDYQGINNDYQDELYMITNVKPAPILLKMGSGGKTYTGSDGQVWLPDRVAPPSGLTNVYFTPAGAADEPAQPYSGPVGNTPDPGLYRTYRGNVGTVAQNQRNLSFSIPINNGTYSVKLHFVDQASTRAGQRIFSVAAQGQTAIANLDIFNESGGRYQALVKQIPDVKVTTGVLTLKLSASVDYPAISAIEIVR